MESLPRRGRLEGPLITAQPADSGSAAASARAHHRQVGPFHLAVELAEHAQTRPHEVQIRRAVVRKHLELQFRLDSWETPT